MVSTADGDDDDGNAVLATAKPEIYVGREEVDESKEKRRKRILERETIVSLLRGNLC